MPHKIHIIVGMPGAGKTHLGQELGCHFIDDLSTLPGSGVGAFMDAPQDADWAVADVNFCDPQMRAVAKWMLDGPLFPNHELVFHFFENDPEKCRVNVAHRADGRNVEPTIRRFTKVYEIPEGETVIPIWQPTGS